MSDEVLNRLEKCLGQEGLSKFSSRVILQFISSKLEEKGSECFSHVLPYLLSLLNKKKREEEKVEDKRKGCPQLIPGLQASPIWYYSTPYNNNNNNNILNDNDIIEEIDDDDINNNENIRKKIIKYNKLKPYINLLNNIKNIEKNYINILNEIKNIKNITITNLKLKEIELTKQYYIGELSDKKETLSSSSTTTISSSCKSVNNTIINSTNTIDQDKNQTKFTGFQHYRSSLKEESSATGRGDWLVFYLLLHGVDFEENEKLCPITSNLIRSIPTQYNHAMFSAISANTHILPHYGPTNKKLRVFFPLDVPLDENGKSLCELHVDGQVLPLYPGHCLIFDDSFLHEAFNFSQSEPRLALIFDIWHPDLSPEEIKVLEYINKAQLAAARKLSLLEKENRIKENEGTNYDEPEDFFTLINRSKEEGIKFEDLHKIWRKEK